VGELWVSSVFFPVSILNFSEAGSGFFPGKIHPFLTQNPAAFHGQKTPKNKARIN